MLNTVRSLRGMVTSPHHLASAVGAGVLRDGGTAIDAAVAMAAALAVVYPHMTGIGGDGFWLIAEPGRDPIGIAACGRAGLAVDAALYTRLGLAAIPTRGPLAANTTAGTVAGWEAALKLSRDWGSALPLSRLLRDAIDYAEGGIVVSATQAALTAEKAPEFKDVPGFAAVFMPGGQAPAESAVLKLPALGATLRGLADRGLDDFYRGEVAVMIAADLARAGSPLTAADLARGTAEIVPPLWLDIPGARLFNLQPPTQGLASLLILGLMARRLPQAADTFEHIHTAVEATKLAFGVRDRVIGDPNSPARDWQGFLAPERLDALASDINPQRARPWPAPVDAGDTVWFGAIDVQGRAASVIQSLFFEFGSGVVLPETGIVWQNRGSSFSLDAAGPRALAPGRQPFHTLNPAMARFADGRTMVYGTMGGDGQPQTQAALFSRYAWFGLGLQEAITAPRWLLGRTWGAESVSLKLESRFDPDVVRRLEQAGHVVEIVPGFTSLVGHAGAIVRRADGVLEGASDPRSDGAAVGW